MSKRQHSMLAYYCDNQSCRALLALLAPGSLIYDTRLRCPLCAHVTKVRKLSIDSARMSDYTESTPAPA